MDDALCGTLTIVGCISPAVALFSDAICCPLAFSLDLRDWLERRRVAASDELNEVVSEAVGFIKADNLSGLLLWLSSSEQRGRNQKVLNSPDRGNGLTVLQHAVVAKQELMVQALCYMAEVDVDSRSSSGLTALGMALEANMMAVAQVLMARSANINAVDDSGEPLVVRMARLGNVPATAFCVAESTNLDARDAKGLTALAHAVTSGSVDVAQMLLQAGADPDVQDKEQGLTALHRAVLAGSAKLVELLLQAGADPEVKEKQQGLTALHQAAVKDSVELSELLLKAGANPEAANVIGLLPSHLCKAPAVRALFTTTATQAPVARSGKAPPAQDMSRMQRSRRRQAQLSTQVATSAAPPVFVSFRVREAGAEAKLLKRELAARGVAAYVCTEELKNGADWGTEIAINLQGCQLMVVMATATYGAKGTEIMGTYEELQYAMRHQIPMFIIKMCPKMQESRAAILVEPRQVEMVAWEAAKPVPDGIVDGIVQKLAEASQADK